MPWELELLYHASGGNRVQVLTGLRHEPGFVPSWEIRRIMMANWVGCHCDLAASTARLRGDEPDSVAHSLT